MFYRSYSGLSGMGWIPDRIGLVVLDTYRIDELYPYIPEYGSLNLIFGQRFAIPINYGRKDQSLSYPIVAPEWEEKEIGARYVPSLSLSLPSPPVGGVSHEIPDL